MGIAASPGSNDKAVEDAAIVADSFKTVDFFSSNDLIVAALKLGFVTILDTTNLDNKATKINIINITVRFEHRILKFFVTI